MAYPHETDDDGLVVRKNPHVDQAAGEPEEVAAVTGRPNDLGNATPEPAMANSTFASRSAPRSAPRSKVMRSTEAEDKRVSRSEDKAVRRGSSK